MWGHTIVDSQGRVGVDASGRMGAFYRGCLRSLLDVGREVHNAVLYVLSAKPPLHVYVAKLVLLFVRSTLAHPRLVSKAM